MRAHTSDEQEARRRHAPSRRSPSGDGVLRLQALAGNGAVASLIRGSAAVRVQRVMELNGKKFASLAEISSDNAAWAAWRAYTDPAKLTQLSAAEVHPLPPAPVAVGAGAPAPAVAAPVPAAAAAAAVPAKVPAKAPAKPAPVLGKDWVKRRDAALDEVRAEVRRAVNDPKTRAGNYFANGGTVRNINGPERATFNKAVRRVATAEGWGVADGPGVTVSVVWGKSGKGSNFNVLVGDGRDHSKWNVHFIY